MLAALSAFTSLSTVGDQLLVFPFRLHDKVICILVNYIDLQQVIRGKGVAVMIHFDKDSASHSGDKFVDIPRVIIGVREWTFAPYDYCILLGVGIPSSCTFLGTSVAHSLVQMRYPHSTCKWLDGSFRIAAYRL